MPIYNITQYRLIVLISIFVFVFFANTSFATPQIKNLERRVKFLEDSIRNLSSRNSEIEELHRAPSNNSFLPEISLMVDFSMVARDITNIDYENYAIQGFVDDIGDDVFHKTNGFNYNYADISFGFFTNKYFDTVSVIRFYAEKIKTEKIIVSTSSSLYGFNIKAGIFKSSFGKENSIDYNKKKFSSNPLIYDAFFGVDGIQDSGIGIEWNEENYIFGFESLRGVNKFSFGQSDSGLYVGYVKHNYHIDASSEIKVGGSIAKGKTQKNKDSQVSSIEFSLIKNTNDNKKILWQSEYLVRKKDEIFQSGIYTQVSYDFYPDWEGGFRLGSVIKNKNNNPTDMHRATFFAGFSTSKSYKIRLQYSLDSSKMFRHVRKYENLLILEFVAKLGS